MFRFTGWAGVALAALPAFAAVPSSDPPRDTVVETRLASRATKQHVQRRLASLRESPETNSNADDGTSNRPLPDPAAETRTRLAASRSMIEEARRSGDPRLLGYALAEIAAAPAVDDPGLQAEALVLHATVEQAQHRFDAARVLLDRALDLRPSDGQALITRATVALVQGRHDDALGDCERLRSVASEVAALCRASIDAATGQGARALATLSGFARASAASRAWALQVAGDVHQGGGDTDAAIRAYSASLALADAPQTRLALADALLDAGRHASALATLAGSPPTDAVLLRRWLALRRTDPRAAATLAAQLASRFDTDAARGAALHVAEAARFALESGRPHDAARLARRQWEAQKTPADALLLARASVAAGDAAAIRELRAWVDRTGLDDARIARELEQRR